MQPTLLGRISTWKWITEYLSLRSLPRVDSTAEAPSSAVSAFPVILCSKSPNNCTELCLILQLSWNRPSSNGGNNCCKDVVAYWFTMACPALKEISLTASASSLKHQLGQSNNRTLSLAIPQGAFGGGNFGISWAAWRAKRQKVRWTPPECEVWHDLRWLKRLAIELRICQQEAPLILLLDLVQLQNVPRFQQLTSLYPAAKGQVH